MDDEAREANLARQLELREELANAREEQLAIMREEHANARDAVAAEQAEAELLEVLERQRENDRLRAEARRQQNRDRENQQVPQPPRVSAFRMSLRALRGSHRPTFYDDPAVIANASVCRACCHLIILSFVLSLPSTLVLMIRCFPALASIRWNAIVSEAPLIFPAGIELLLNDSSLSLRPDPLAVKDTRGSSSGTDEKYVCWSQGDRSWCAEAPLLEPIRLRLPSMLHDAFYTSLPSPLPVPPARLLYAIAGAASNLLEDDLMLWAEVIMGGTSGSGHEDFPAICELEEGEEAGVEVLGGYSSLMWGGGWRRAKVITATPARDMALFEYGCKLLDGDGGGGEVVEVEGSGGHSIIRKRADHVRRIPSILLAHDDYFTADLSSTTSTGKMPPALREELLGLHTDVLLGPNAVHSFLGFSFQFGQYWQFKSSTRPTTWVTGSTPSIDSLRTYKPFGLVIDYLCTQEEGGGSDDGSNEVLHCSRRTAQHSLHRLTTNHPWLTYCNGPLGLHVWLSTTSSLLLGWSRYILFTTPNILFLQMPLTYVLANLLRHVDTPLTSYKALAMLSAYSATPFSMFEEVLDLAMLAVDGLRSVWTDGRPGDREGEGGEEAEEAADAADESSSDSGSDWWSWLTSRLLTLTSISYILTQIEYLCRWLQDSPRVRIASHVLFTCYLAARLRWNETTKELSIRQARRKRGISTTTSNSDSTAAAVGGGSGDGSAGDDAPSCRICFSGSENGQLVSPCLCSGSMRFVHVECLTQWRQMSANPLSFVQCENCLYKYSFRRALYASILRSALVLHLITLLLLAMLLFCVAITAQHIDESYLNGTLRANLPIPTISSELQTTVSDGPAAYFGIDASYLLASLTVIGVSGFLSLGMLGPMLWPGRGQQDSLLIIMILVGLARTFMILYGSVKKRSGRLLREAERMIVDVGESAPDAEGEEGEEVVCPPAVEEAVEEDEVTAALERAADAAEREAEAHEAAAAALAIGIAAHLPAGQVLGGGVEEVPQDEQRERPYASDADEEAEERNMLMAARRRRRAAAAAEAERWAEAD